MHPRSSPLITAPGVLLTAALLLAVPSVFAQTTAPKRAEPVIELSPFDVSATATRGYMTTSALSASRIAVPITELNSSIVVINEKLIEDTMATSMRDTFNMVSGVTHGNSGTGSQSQNVISMRGYTLSGTQRDGVSDVLVTASGGFDYALFDRVEIVKGPSGVLYGTHSPGGIVNLISKRPLHQPRTKVSASYGSFSAYRFDVDHSGVAGDKKQFGYRVSLANADTDGPNGYSFEPSGGLVILNPSLSYRARNGWNFWAWGAYVRDNLSRTMPTTHGFATSTTINPRTNVPVTGRALVDKQTNANVIMNNSVVNTDSYELGLTKSFDLTRGVTLDLRLLARSFDQTSVADRVRGNAGVSGITADEVLDAAGNRLGTDTRLIQYNVAAAQMAAMTRPVIRYDQGRTLTEGETYAADFNLNFKLGPTSHKLLTYYTLNDAAIRSSNVTNDIRSTTALAALGVPIVNGVARLPLWPTRPISVDRDTVVSRADVRVVNATVITDGPTEAMGVIERFSFWNDRVFLTGGFRRTELDIATTSITAAGVTTTTQAVTKKDTKSYGGLGKVIKGEQGEVSVFYNHNDTFTPVTAIDRRINLSAGVPNPNFLQRFPDRLATTSEYGVKTDLFGSKLVLTGSVFKITEDNVLIPGVDNTGVITGLINGSYSLPSGVRVTKGWEVDANYAPMPGWEFIATYSKVDPKLENGANAQGVPLNTASLTARYEVQTGPLKNLSAMWMWTNWGDWTLGARTFWRMPGGENHVAVLGYRWKDWTVRLRVENVFDQKELLPSDFETAIGISTERNFRLGVTYVF
jgi:outer membrane receptor protein involved in Fe transport